MLTSAWRRLAAILILLLGVSFVPIAIAVLVSTADVYMNACFGPTALPPEQLAGLTDPGSLNLTWRTFPADEATDTGYILEGIKNNTEASRSKAYLVRVGERWLVAFVPLDFKGHEITAKLVPLETTAWKRFFRSDFGEDAFMAGKMANEFPRVGNARFFLDGTVDERRQAVFHLAIIAGFAGSAFGLIRTGLGLWGPWSRRRLA